MELSLIPDALSSCWFWIGDLPNRKAVMHLFVSFWFKCIFECGVSVDDQCLPKFKCVVSEEAEEKMQFFFFRDFVVEGFNVVEKQISEFFVLIHLAFEDWFLHV